jgi:hypothetical protein
MESLAFFAAVIVSLTVIGGPLAVALTYLPPKLLPAAFLNIFAILISLIAILIGIMLIINVNSTGATFMGSFGAGCGVFAIYRVARKFK